jgi:hypothetical protein
MIAAVLTFKAGLAYMIFQEVSQDLPICRLGIVPTSFDKPEIHVIDVRYQTFSFCPCGLSYKRCAFVDTSRQ